VLKGFKEFIMRGNIVDLAVAVVIGTAFKAVVDALVANIITPIIAAIGGQPDFSTLTFTINKSKFLYGAFINTIISFVIVAAAIYFVVVLPLNKMAERRAARLAAGQPVEEAAAKGEDVVLLEQIRDLLQAQGGGSSVSTAKPSPGV
jgi:large conductance mechanosensitive channel